MNNSIYIRRKNKLYIEKGSSSLPNEYLVGLMINIKSLGYTLSPNLQEIIKTISLEKLSIFYKKLIIDLKENVGANVEFMPMYPNFPDQVEKLSEEELYRNAIFHYFGDWIGKRFLPKYEKIKREPLKDNKNLKIIELGTKEEFNLIFTRLINSKTAISEVDRKDIQWFVKNYGQNIFRYLPNEIPSKENTAYFLGCLLLNNIENNELFNKHLKTATDVLRLATAISEGDISLAENSKFKKMSKKTRKQILQSLENFNNITEDMLRYKEQWKRLGEILHPFEYQKRFPKCYNSFDIIRNKKPFKSFNCVIERLILEGDTISATKVLKTRPGELARRLDKLVRTSKTPQSILEVFSEISSEISTLVLLQVHCHFKARSIKKELRVFFPKGNIGKLKAIEDSLPTLDPSICNNIVKICENALINKFKNKKSLGNIYIDEQLKNFNIPFAMRSASKALKTISRGSKILLPSGNTIRFFIYWKDGASRTDLDLSALALDKDSTFKTTIAYYNLKDFGGFHSGDITSAPNGASEFIDIDILKFVNSGIRYVVMSINSFTDQPYCDLPICFAGFMIRQFPNSGEIYDPLTVENKFDLTANTRISLPLIIDLIERKVIWTDISLNRNPSTQNNVHNNLSSMCIINKSMVSLIKPNLYDLFDLHARARGNKVLKMEEANVIFSVNDGIKPIDTDIIMSEFL